jgi:hypothetical protein
MPNTKIGRLRVYVGIADDGKRRIFQALAIPTTETHGHLFAAVIGPFQTEAGAAVMAESQGGNPHCQTVADAERIAAARWCARRMLPGLPGDPLPELLSRAAAEAIADNPLAFAQLVDDMARKTKTA